MRKGNFLIFVSLTAALLVFGAACRQPAGNEHSTMNHNSMNHNSMNHNSVNQNSMNHTEMKSDLNAAAQAFDLQFIDTMTHHHDGAVEMSALARQKSSNEELKKFAQKIIDDQQREIALLKEWREKWFAGKPPAVNMEMPGMADSMKMMTGDGMKKLDAATGKEFDLMFLELMTEHHKGALVMAQDALSKAEHAEIKTLAGQIIKAQEAEIKQMSEWKSNWSK
jgi:uncharacterized protein (DUF305 family)